MPPSAQTRSWVQNRTPRFAAAVLVAVYALAGNPAANRARAAGVATEPCFGGLRYKRSLDTNFSGDTPWRYDRGGRWLTQFPWGRTNPTGGDAAYYVDPSAAFGPSPFSVVDGNTLAIRARPASKELQARISKYEFTSGLITTARSTGAPTFSQRYGYYEVAAKLPSGRGLWPAFWLRDSLGGIAEIDVFEFLGDDTNTIYQSVHYASGKSATHRFHPSFDPTTGFHDYGVLVTPDSDTFYVDGVATHSVPDASTNALYVIISMQVGAAGSWPGPPDATTHWPATLYLQSFRAFEPTGTACGR